MSTHSEQSVPEVPQDRVGYLKWLDAKPERIISGAFSVVLVGLLAALITPGEFLKLLPFTTTAMLILVFVESLLSYLFDTRDHRIKPFFQALIVTVASLAAVAAFIIPIRLADII